MSNVNDNNLDDLLRRAAEKYPLRTDSADFEKLVADLEKDPSLILPPLNTEDRRRRRRFFWLFLFLPLAGGAYYAWHTTSGRAHQTEIARGQQATAPKATAETEGKNGPKAGVAKTKGEDGGGAITSTAGANGKGASATTPGEGEKGDNSVATHSRPAGESRKGTSVKAAGEKEKSINAVTPGERTKGKEVTTKGKNRGAANEGTTGNRNDKPPVELLTAENSSALVESNARMAGGKVSLAATKGAVAVNIPVRSNAAELVKNSAPAKDKIKLQKPKHSFYVGILGSPDLSTIKFQSVKNAGFNFGVLLGYSFNSRWAVETGLYYSHKKYYTDGEYFDTKGMYQFNNVDEFKVTGECNMWEIPLNVRYNLSTGEKMKWFATAGLSTYFMTKQAYDCVGTKNGNPWWWSWDHNVAYHSWFSVLNLSVGFEQRLGKIGNLRLEPYVRVPMGGIGRGNLSITSAGLNIGITRRIW